jgi:geranylgeranyl pyrophosphate synthase
MSGSAALLGVLQQTGSVAFAEERARALVGEAIESLAGLPESGAKRTLELLARAVVDRSH